MINAIKILYTFIREMSRASTYKQDLQMLQFRIDALEETNKLMKKSIEIMMKREADLSNTVLTYFINAGKPHDRIQNQNQEQSVEKKKEDIEDIKENKGNKPNETIRDTDPLNMMMSLARRRTII